MSEPEKSSIHSWGFSKNQGDDYTLRPKTLEGFTGQSQLKRNLGLFIEAAKQRKEALDHVFLSGGPGLGKTTLSYIIAHELGVDIRITNAPAIEKPKDIIGILSTLAAGNVLFIDEIHRLKSSVEEILYVAMEDYVVDWVIGTGTEARTVRIPINRFTLVGATTQPEKVSAPLHSRFGIKERLDIYKTEDIKDIVVHTTTLLHITIEDEAAQFLARICRGTPRYAIRLVKRIRDFAQVQGVSHITKKLVEYSIKELGIDEMGLEAIDRKILRVLTEDFKGQPVGLKTLAIAVNESPDSLEDFWEQYLIRQGLLQRTAQGRRVTPKAWEILKLDPPPHLYDAPNEQGNSKVLF